MLLVCVCEWGGMLFWSPIGGTVFILSVYKCFCVCVYICVQAFVGVVFFLIVCEFVYVSSSLCVNVCVYVRFGRFQRNFPKMVSHGSRRVRFIF